MGGKISGSPLIVHCVCFEWDGSFFLCSLGELLFTFHTSVPARVQCGKQKPLWTCLTGRHLVQEMKCQQHCGKG